MKIYKFLIFIFSWHKSFSIEKNKNMKNNNLFKGAVILSAGAVLAKIFSALYRILLTRILGGEGMGLYQLIFPLYSLCVVLATAGLPMAISKVVAKHSNNQKLIVRKCLLFTLLVASLLSLILFLSGNGIASLQGQKDLGVCYVILAPTIIIISASSVLRGYFQGVKNFTPSAISNILEQFIKLCLGLVLSVLLLPYGLISAIIGAVVGIAVSEVFSCFVLIVCYIKAKKTEEKSVKISLKSLFADILPITLTNIILPVTSFLDSIFVVKLLALNFSNDVSVFLYGLESGAVASLVSLPTIFSFAIASVILPSLTTKQHIYNKKTLVELSSKIILLITIPCVLFFCLGGQSIFHVLYGNRLNGLNLNGIDISYGLLIVSSAGIVPFALNQVYSCCLQAINKRFETIKNLSIAAFIRLVLELVLLPIKKINIYAIATANVVCYIIVFVLNLRHIKNDFKVKLELDFFVKVFLSGLISSVALKILLQPNLSFFKTIIAFAFAAVVYVVSLFVVDIFNKKEKAYFKYKV